MNGNDLADTLMKKHPDMRIVFTSGRENDVDIYSMNADGSDLKRLTTREGYDGGPFYSADGTKIVYRAYHPEDPKEMQQFKELLAQKLVQPTKMDIWIMDADGGNQHQVTSLPGAQFAPFFHPDGQRVIFASNHENPRGYAFDLFIMNIDGSGIEKVTTHEEFDSFPMFSPDGSMLIWASNRHGAKPHETNIFVADWVE